MFIYVQSMWSKEEINADSNYVVWTQFIRAARKLRPDINWIVMFPDAQSGYKYEDDGFFGLPGVSRVQQRVPTRRTANAVNFPASWYESLFRKFGFDAVWCHLPEVAAQIKASGRTTREAISKPSVVTQHNYVVHDSLPYEFHEHLALMELSGALCSDVNVFNSDYCREMFDDIATRYLTPSVVQRIADKSVKINYGTLEPELVPPDPLPDNKIPIIAYNHRLLTHKRYADTFEVLDQLHREGVKFKLWYLNNTNERVGILRKYPWAELKLSRTRDEYLTKLRMCDLNVIHSLHETFCISGAESMALGQPLVAPDGITFPEITGRNAGNEYPWLFKSDADSKGMLRKLLTDQSARRKWGGVASAHVTNAYNTTLWVGEYMKVFDSFSDHKIGTSPERVDVVRKGVKACEGRTLAELYTWLTSDKGHVGGKHWFGTQTATMTKLLRLVRHVGGSVVLRNGLQEVRSQ